MPPEGHLHGFRALKNTPEAPYTTKVNYREHTTLAVEPDPGIGIAGAVQAPAFNKSKSSRTLRVHSLSYIKFYNYGMPCG